jgi:hypothetical protein
VDLLTFLDGLHRVRVGLVQAGHDPGELDPAELPVVHEQGAALPHGDDVLLREHQEQGVGRGVG